VLSHQLHSIDPVSCLSDDSYVRKKAEQRAQQLAENIVVVGEDGTCRRRASRRDRRPAFR